MLAAERISLDGVGPGAIAVADRTELARAAFALVLTGVGRHQASSPPAAPRQADSAQPREAPEPADKTQQIVFRFEIEEGPKVAEVEVTMPDGTSQVQEIYNDTVLGFNKHNEEVVRITVQEPTFERPTEAHVNSI